MMRWDAHVQIDAPFIAYTPAVDGVVLTDKPAVLLENKQMNPVTIMVGSNADEGTLFSQLPYDATEKEYEAYLTHVLGPNVAPKVWVMSL